MLGDAIEYKSHRYEMREGNDVLEKTKTDNGITCIWSGRHFGNLPTRFTFTWEFDWNELKNQGVVKLTGHINVFPANDWLAPETIDVKLTENNQVITKEVTCSAAINIVYYKYSLTPYYIPISENPSYDKMFASSDQNDTILIVDGKKLHVSRSFLSYHSEYFRALFSSNYKEGQMDEIPIGEVSYEDFALLLSSFYLNPVFPNDRTVEKLLEMGRRFLVSSAISISDYHLLNNSKINNEKMLWLADEYVMPSLLERCIRELDTVEKVKKLHQSPEYEKLSDNAKVKVLDRLIKMI